MSAGLLGSWTGLGGGFVILPFLTSPVVSLSQHSATATSLLSVATTGSFSALSYSSSDCVDWTGASVIAGGGMVGARVGIKAASKLSGGGLRKALGVLMIAVGATLPVKDQLLPKHEHEKDSAIISTETSLDVNVNVNSGSHPRPLTPAEIGKFGTIGLFSGFLSGMFGVGGGSIVVPALL